MTDKITMDRQWAFRHSPTTPIKILTVEANGERPVLAQKQECNTLFMRRADGRKFANCSHDDDIVPLQREPRVFWVNIYDNGNIFGHRSEMEAVNGIGVRNSSAETIKVVEVLA